MLLLQIVYAFKMICMMGLESFLLDVEIDKFFKFDAFKLFFSGNLIRWEIIWQAS